MAIVPFVDYTGMALVLLMMIIFDLFGYMTKIGAMYLGAGMLGVYTLGSIFAQQGLIQSSAYNAVTAAWVKNQVDPNLAAVIMAVTTILSFYFVYWERNLTG